MRHSWKESRWRVPKLKTIGGIKVGWRIHHDDEVTTSLLKCERLWKFNTHKFFNQTHKDVVLATNNEMTLQIQVKRGPTLTSNKASKRDDLTMIHSPLVVSSITLEKHSWNWKHVTAKEKAQWKEERRHKRMKSEMKLRELKIDFRPVAPLICCCRFF